MWNHLGAIAVVAALKILASPGKGVDSIAARTTVVRLIAASALMTGAVVLAAHPVVAQEPEEEGHEAPQHAFDNEIAVFVGNTRKLGGDAFTVGMEYIRELTPRFGTGIFFDWATNHAERSFIAGIPLYIQSGLGHLSITVGAGVEKETEVEVEHETEEDEAHGGGYLFLARFGAQYPFHFGSQGRFVVAPQTNLDLTKNENAWVLGAIVGVAF